MLCLQLTFPFVQIINEMDEADEEDVQPLRKTPKRAPLRPKKGEGKKAARVLFGEGTGKDTGDNVATESEDEDVVANEVAALRYS